VERGEPNEPEIWARWWSGRIKDPPTEHVLVHDQTKLDLLIISDTPIRMHSFYPPIKETKQPLRRLSRITSGINKKTSDMLGNLNVGHFFQVSTIALVLLASNAFLTVFYPTEGREFLSIFVGDFWERVGNLGLFLLEVIVPLALVLVVGLSLFLVRSDISRKIKELQEIKPDWKKRPRRYINRLRLQDVWQMGDLRVGSVVALTSTIFMNRIRSLSYSAAFSRPDLDDRIMTNQIFTLRNDQNPDNELIKLLKADSAWPPTKELDDIIFKAATMKTKLWIDHNPAEPLHDLDVLVISGQATFCFNLMKFMLEDCREDGEWIVSDTALVFEQALEEWKKLIADPTSLLKERKGHSRLEALRAEALAV
jgi:hypothetical protein